MNKFLSVCSYKMHLLSKHKFFAPAEKLLHEYFTIINQDTGEKIIQDTPLNILVSAAIDSASSITSKSIRGDSSPPKAVQSMSENEKITNLKRALIDANIIISPTSESEAATSQKKMRFLMDDLNNEKLENKKINNENERDESYFKNRVNLDETSGITIPYDTEKLDDGSTIYICSKCKLVFLKKNLLFEHKCFIMPSLLASNNDTSSSGYNAKNKILSESMNHENDEKIMITEENKDVQLNFKTFKSNGDNEDKEMINSNQNDDYDIIKNNSDIIYIE